jgi:hypothetical protein
VYPVAITSVCQLYHQLTALYETFRVTMGNPNMNSGMVKKCLEQRQRAVATEFESLVILNMGLTTGLNKRRQFQAALRTLTSESCPLELVHPLLLQYAQEQGKPKASGTTSSDATAIVAAS